ncbi:MAG: GGDEF domain-containing protein [Actinomycetota bacterium]
MPREAPSPRRPVPSVHALRVTSQHLHHVTGPELDADPVPASEVAVLGAVAALFEDAPTAVGDLLQHVCRTAAAATGCDLAAVRLPDGQFAVLQRGGVLAGSGDEVAAVVRRLLDGPERGALLVQDAATRPLPPPLAPVDGASSYLALPLALDEGSGCLLLVRAAVPPRPLTDLDVVLATRLADGARRLVDAASARERLEAALTSSREHARRDPLTGVANRRGWDEALADATRLVAAGDPYTVVTVDVDELKAVNDSLGHFGGDELIVACAHTLRHAVRGARDVVARLGGDEFGLLVAGPGTPAQLITRRLRSSLDGVRTPSGLGLRTSIGAASCPPFGSLPEAVRRADAAMYVEKRARRAPRVPR